MSVDENKSSRSSYTREISTRADSEEKMFPDHVIRHIHGEFMPTPSPQTTLRVNPRKVIKKANHKLPSREATIGEKTETIISSTPRDEIAEPYIQYFH